MSWSSLGCIFCETSKTTGPLHLLWEVPPPPLPPMGLAVGLHQPPFSSHQHVGLSLTTTSSFLQKKAVGTHRFESQHCRFQPVQRETLKCVSMRFIRKACQRSCSSLRVLTGSCCCVGFFFVLKREIYLLFDRRGLSLPCTHGCCWHEGACLCWSGVSVCRCAFIHTWTP